MDSLHCNYQNCKYLHPKRLRSVNQNQNPMFCQEYIPTYAKSARKNFDPRMNSSNNSPFIRHTQHQYSVVNQEDKTQQNCHTFKEDIPTFAQIVKKDYVGQSPFLGQAIQSQQTVMKQENQVQSNTQDSFLEFMKSQKEILRRLEKLEVQNNQIQNTYKTLTNC